MGSKLTRNFATQEDLEKLGVLDAELFDSALVALPLVDPQNVDGTPILDGDRVLFSNLADADLNNRIHQATVGGGTISWEPVSTAELTDDQKVLIDKGNVEENNFKQIQGGAWKTANEGVTGGGEANTNTNAGAGGATLRDLVKAKAGVDTPIKRLKQGANITLVDNGDDIEISTAAGVGEANVNTNAGTGVGKVAKAKAGVDTPLKSIKAGTNIAVVNNADDITLNATGEANTNTNVGTGAGTIANAKAGVNTPLKTIKAGANITVTNNANDITISGPAAGGVNLVKSARVASVVGGAGAYTVTGLTALIAKAALGSDILVKMLANGKGGHVGAGPPFTTVDTAGLTILGGIGSTGAKVGLFVNGVLESEYFRISGSTLDNMQSLEWLVSGLAIGNHTLDIRVFELFPGPGSWQISNSILTLEEK